MPFVKQTALPLRYPGSETRDHFIGRASELHLFREHLLTPADPTYNVLAVWGPAGVGKTTLLARLRDEARTVDFYHSCLTALVDERCFTPADLMERCAAELRLAGAPLAAFEQVAARYKQALQPRHDEQTVARAAFVREVAALTKAKVMDEPVVGGLYETVAREANASFESPRSASRVVGEAGPLHDPLDDLVRAFVDDLNWLTSSSSQRVERRVILFFDAGVPSTVEAVTWLLRAVLRIPISNQVVLVVAGREPIDRSLLDELPVYSMPLTPFTEDETRTYLAERGMTAADPVATIWRLSGGLPLSVGMLAGDQGRHLDETADLVTNMQRWIAAQDYHKQRLVLHAALFSRPFTQDDLAAFQTLPEPERTSHYHWLIGLPFVQHSTLDGRHRYHELAQQVMRRALLHLAPQEEQAARRALAQHYRRQMERMQAAEGKRIFYSCAWLELALARVAQLFSLPDVASQASAIEQVLVIVHEAKHEQEPVGINQRTRLVRLSDVGRLRPIIDPTAAITDEIHKLDLLSIPRQQAQIVHDHQHLLELVQEIRQGIEDHITQTRRTFEEGTAIHQEQMKNWEHRFLSDHAAWQQGFDFLQRQQVALTDQVAHQKLEIERSLNERKQQAERQQQDLELVRAAMMDRLQTILDTQQEVWQEIQQQLERLAQDFHKQSRKNESLLLFRKHSGAQTHRSEQKRRADHEA